MKPIVNSPIPHILLPVLLFTALYVPPFPRRTLLFSTAILLTVACNTFNAYPPDLQTRILLAGGLNFLSVLEKLLCHPPSPEHHFWRLDHEVREAERMPPFSLAKANWALSLLLAPRGVGWNHAVRGVPRVEDPNEPRGRFVVRRLAAAAFWYLVMDGAATVLGAVGGAGAFPTRFSLRELPTIVFVEGVLALSMVAGFSFPADLLAAVSVAVGLCQPKDWPPLFGNISDLTTVKYFWGSFWHILPKQPALGFSHYLITLLDIPRPSLSAYTLHVFVAFALSALSHIITLLPFAAITRSIPAAHLIAAGLVFWMSQACAVAAETAVIGWFQRKAKIKRRLQAGTSDDAPDKAAAAGPSSLLWPVVGRLWVAAWLVGTGWWVMKGSTMLGMWEWTVVSTPRSLTKPLLQWLGVSLL